MFRSLCIDYRTRAHDVLAREHDVQLRHTALNILPYHDCSSCGCNNDDCHEISKVDNSAVENQDHQEELKIFRYYDGEDCPDSISPFESLTSKNSIQSMIYNLGPTVHPSECALRIISPVNDVLKRKYNRNIYNIYPSLDRIREMHAILMKEELREIVASMDCRSSIFQNNPCISNDDTFFQTIMTLYSKMYFHHAPVLLSGELDLDSIDRKRDKKSKPEIWSHKMTNLSLSESIFLKHEPPGMERLIRQNFCHLSNSSIFAEKLLSLFHRSRSLSNKSFSLDGDSRNGSSETCMSNWGDSRKINTVSSKPPLSFMVHDDLKLKANDFKSKQPSNSATEVNTRSLLLSKELLKDEMSISTWQHMSDSDNVKCFIRIDPDIPLHDSKSSRNTPILIHKSLKTLEQLYSATSISSRLLLPHRFEAAHEYSREISRFMVSLRPTFKLLDDAITQCDDSVIEYSSTFKSSPEFIESKQTFINIFRKISLESNISLFTKRSLGCERMVDEVTNKSVILLPKFSETFQFPLKSHEKMQKHFVESSACVKKHHLLKNVDGSNRATFLFLPQIMVNKRKVVDFGCTDQHKFNHFGPNPSALISSVRLSVISNQNLEDISLFEKQSCNYPIEPWFHAHNSNLLRSNIAWKAKANLLTEDEEAILKAKRDKFCEHAIVCGNEEESLNFILTSCSSKRTSDAKVEYRGFLTNEIVDPKVYHYRYKSLLEMNIFRRNNEVFLPQQRYKTFETVSNPESFFVGMTWKIMINALLRQMNTYGRKQSLAQFAKKLQTKKHSNKEYAISQDGKRQCLKTQSKISCMNPSKINDLASTYTCDNSINGQLTSDFGKDALKARRELLHLVSKAIELQSDEKAYLEELAVLKTGRVKNRNQHKGLCESKRRYPDEETICWSSNKRSLTNMEYMRKNAKKSNVDRVNNIEKRSIQHKKSKSKKRKKHHSKRKSRDEKKIDNKNERNLKNNMDENTLGAEFAANESSLGAIRQNLRLVIPSIPVKMTPILPFHNGKRRKCYDSRQMESLKNPVASIQNDDIIDTIDMREKTKNSPPSTTNDKSPDSLVSSLHGRKDSFLVASRDIHSPCMLTPKAIDQSCNVYSDLRCDEGSKTEYFCDKTMELRLDDEDRVNRQISLSPRSRKLKYNEHRPQSTDTKKSSLCHGEDNQTVSDRRIERNESVFTLLSSESFLEKFGEIIVELVSGRWRKNLTSKESFINRMSGNITIKICDCPLVDIAGVDIELADNSGIVVQRLSSWIKSDESIQNVSRAFIRSLVLLAASGRFASLHVILCLDIDMTSIVSNEIVTLQNAFVNQSGCPCESVTFEYVASRVLAVAIAIRLLSIPTTENDVMIDTLADENVVERARFLMTLVPSMTVHMALNCLCFSNDSTNSTVGSTGKLSNIFCLAKTMKLKEFIEKTSTIISGIAAHQLWLATNVDLSNAY